MTLRRSGTDGADPGRKHHEDVRGRVLAGDEKVAGWGRHVRLYTWVALGVAAGFWIVTHRRRTVPIRAHRRNRYEDRGQDRADRGTRCGTIDDFLEFAAGGAASFLTTMAFARLRTMRPAVSKSASLCSATTEILEDRSRSCKRRLHRARRPPLADRAG